jgi:hypothetical protein
MSDLNDGNAWKAAFEDRHQFDVYPDHFMTGLRNEFAAGWHAALKAASSPKCGSGEAKRVPIDHDILGNPIYTPLDPAHCTPVTDPGEIAKARAEFAKALAAYIPPAQPAQDDLRALIADDAYAMSFQTMGQYRTALLKAASSAQPAQDGRVAPTRPIAYHFHRFVNGEERAEDILIERATTLEAAIKAAVNCCPKQRMTVLVHAPAWNGTLHGGSLAARASSPAPSGAAPWRHKKTGGIYQIIAESRMEHDPKAVVVTYRNVETGEMWTRPYGQFYDGRFERIDTGSDRAD